MNVTVIFTGGTIGSRLNSDGYIGTYGSNDYRLLNMYNDYIEKKIANNNSCNSEISFTTYEPYTILSENLNSTCITTLISYIKKVLSDRCTDGIIVTHGTDTLAYTAAILSYVFADASIPVVLVSSDYVLEDSRANGFDNFCHAIEFIKSGYRGVFVSYMNKGGAPLIHYGSRLSNPVPFSGDVFSIKNKFLGSFDALNNFCLNTAYTCGAPLPLANEPCIPVSSNILRLVPSCGMTYPGISDNIYAVLLESYHSGTICVDDSLLHFTDEARKKNIPVFLSGLNSEASAYDSVKAYESAGITAITDISPVALYCKLWLLSGTGLDINEYISKPFANDTVTE